ncbi:glycosyltransferase, partial [Mesorhizobium japonicum]|uniref:glycosyltransferase n=1 Tax=Mesorhizobium japonicum TaxID=2066070 RepID=UPI003B594C2B
MSPSIVIAHDYLTQQGGAERVALELASLLGAESIVTSVYAPSRTFAGFARFDVGQSFLRRIPFFATDPRRALPLLAAAWSRMPPIAADVVVCSSSGWAHGVPTRAGTRKVVYCHNPARWLYQPQDYLTEQPLPVRLALAALRPFLIGWD